jgi:hypothetical protein
VGLVDERVVVCLFIYCGIGVRRGECIGWSAGCLVSVCQIICILNRDFF